jgi:hypothetical protein
MQSFSSVAIFRAHRKQTKGKAVKYIKLAAAAFLASGYVVTAQTSTNVSNIAMDIKQNFDYVLPIASGMAVVAVGISAVLFWMRKGSKGRA